MRVEIVIDNAAELFGIGMHGPDTGLEFADFRLRRTKRMSIGEAIEDADDIRRAQRRTAARESNRP